MNLVACIQEIVARVQATQPAYPPANEIERLEQLKSDRILVAITALPGVETSPTLRHTFGEYTIHVGIVGAEAAEAEVLNWLRPFDIAAAPEVAALLPFDGGTVLVTRYWATPGERIVKLTADIQIPEAARLRFRRDLGILADHGKLHPMAERSGAWSVSEQSRTIVLSPWHGVEAIRSPGQLEEMFVYVDGMLARRAAP